MSQKSNDEIDLGVIFEKIKEGYYNFLVFLYGLFKFILKSWIIILVLIVAGVVYGFIKDNPEKARETTLLVQINGDAASYVYDAIDQLQWKIYERDTVLLKKMGFYKNEVFFIGKVDIEPVVNVMDIVDQTPENNRNFEIVMEETQYEDQVLTSDIFVPEYQVHKITMTLGYWANQTHIDRFLEYLNDNDAYNGKAEVHKKNLKFRIDENYKSIAYMDSLFNTYGKPVSEIKKGENDVVSFFDLNITNIDRVFLEKGLLMEKNQKLELLYSDFDSLVVLLNKPMLAIKKSFFDKKKLIYPIVFVFAFLAFSAIRYYFFKAKKLSEERQARNDKQ